MNKEETEEVKKDSVTLKIGNEVEQNNKEKPLEKNENMPTLKEVIMEQVIEGEAPITKDLTLRKILGGDLLNTSTIRNNIWLFILITVFMIIYIGNRYSCQKDLIELDLLKKELQDAKYRSLSSNSKITEKSRESNVLEMLRNNKDTLLHMADQPPYIINVPE